MSAPFVSVVIEDNAIGNFPYNNLIIEDTKKKTETMNRLILLGLVFFLLVGGATAATVLVIKSTNDDSPTEVPPAGPYLYERPPFRPKDGFEAMWWDEFEGDDIDRSKWFVLPDVTDYYRIRELQHYMDDPSTVNVSNGTLNIIASNPPGVVYDEISPNYNDTFYTSARINTNKTGGNWNPGMFADNSTWSTIRVEARIKIARGPGIVSAFWMLPVVNECHAEIDIFETPSCDIAHSGSWVTRDDSYHKNGFETAETYDRFCNDYVVYTLEWSAEYISYYIDDKLVGTTGVGRWYGKCPGAQDPYVPYANRPFYVILNLSIGTKWSGVPQNDIFPATTSVDYVRVSGVRDM